MRCGTGYQDPFGYRDRTPDRRVRRCGLRALSWRYEDPSKPVRVPVVPVQFVFVIKDLAMGNLLWWHTGVIYQVYPRSLDRKSTRLNSSHVKISYAVFCLKKKTNDITK